MFITFVMDESSYPDPTSQDAIVLLWPVLKMGTEKHNTPALVAAEAKVLSDLLCVKRSLISQQFTSGFVELTLHNLHSHWWSHQPERHVLCADTLSAHTHRAVQASQTCHFPHSYCYRLPKYMSYLLIIGCTVPGGVLSK